MKLLQTQITPLVEEPLFIDAREQQFLSSPFHCQPAFHSHPEIELTFIEEGYGRRLIGNTVEYFEAGDMVLIGPNVPHLWLSDPAFYRSESALRSKVIVTYLNPLVFASLFDTLKEFVNIKAMINDASKGIRIHGKTRDIVAERLRKLAHTNGFERVNGLMQILHLISVTNEKKFILQDRLIPTTYPGNSDKLVAVIAYLKDNIGRPITLKDAAEVACMSEASFSRFFKQRMKVNFSAYQTELRMDLAKELLLKEGLSVKEIAYQCGYGSLAHFHKVFKKHEGVSPAQLKIKSGLRG